MGKTITMDSDALAFDSEAFHGWSDKLHRIWVDGLASFNLTDYDVGFTGGMPRFMEQFSSALSTLSEFIHGSDNPAERGGVGALRCFSTALTDTKTVSDQTAAEALTAVRNIED